MRNEDNSHNFRSEGYKQISIHEIFHSNIKKEHHGNNEGH